MSRLRAFLFRLRGLFRRQTLESEMSDELRAHLDGLIERHLAAGMSLDEARYAAQRKFGNLGVVQQTCREQRGWTRAAQFSRDVRHAARSLRRSPGFTAAVVTTLALGIGACIAIFSVVHSLLLAPLPYADPDRLVQVSTQHPEQGKSFLQPALMRDVAADNRSFAAIAAFRWEYFNLSRTDTPSRILGAYATADFFSLFGVQAALGRTWSPDETRAGGPRVVVLTHGLWQSQFFGAADVLGREIFLDDQPHTVIGVMPRGFKDPFGSAELWKPIEMNGAEAQERASRFWKTFARLKADSTIASANTDLAVLAASAAQDFPDVHRGWTLVAQDLRTSIVGYFRTPLLLILGAVGCVLLITCANVAGLCVVRALERRRELGIRAALGASQCNLTVPLLAESLLLALGGGALGVGLGTFGLHALLGSMPNGWLPRGDEIALSQPVIAAAVVLTLVTGVAFGLAPGWMAARIDAASALSGTGRSSPGPGVRRLRHTLVVMQLSLALVLLAGAGLLARSFLTMMSQPSGLRPERLLTLTLALSQSKYDTPQKRSAFYERVTAEIANVPGVESAGFTQTIPFKWGTPLDFAPEGMAPSTAHALAPAVYDSISIDFFKAAGIPLRAGRGFTEADKMGARPVLILNETAARRYFGEEPAIGRRLVIPSSPRARPLEIVGVVGDVRRNGLAYEAPPQVYRPLLQRPPEFSTLMVRTHGAPAAVVGSIQSALSRIDPDQPHAEVVPMTTILSDSAAQPRLYLTLFAVFAVLSLVLAAVGLYGLVAYSVAQRRREFGIRIALGASAGDMHRLVLRDGARLIVVGLALGLVATVAVKHLIEKLLFNTSATDPLVFVGVAALLGLTALLASWLPARRATRIDPIVALRVD